MSDVQTGSEQQVPGDPDSVIFNEFVKTIDDALWQSQNMFDLSGKYLLEDCKIDNSFQILKRSLDFQTTAVETARKSVIFLTKDESCSEIDTDDVAVSPIFKKKSVLNEEEWMIEIGGKISRNAIILAKLSHMLFKIENQSGNSSRFMTWSTDIQRMALETFTNARTILEMKENGRVLTAQREANESVENSLETGENADLPNNTTSPSATFSRESPVVPLINLSGSSQNSITQPPDIPMIHLENVSPVEPSDTVLEVSEGSSASQKVQTNESTTKRRSRSRSRLHQLSSKKPKRTTPSQLVSDHEPVVEDHFSRNPGETSEYAESLVHQRTQQIHHTVHQRTNTMVHNKSSSKAAKRPTSSPQSSDHDQIVQSIFDKHPNERSEYSQGLGQQPPTNPPITIKVKASLFNRFNMPNQPAQPNSPQIRHTPERTAPEPIQNASGNPESSKPRSNTRNRTTNKVLEGTTQRRGSRQRNMKFVSYNEDHMARSKNRMPSYKAPVAPYEEPMPPSEEPVTSFEDPMDPLANFSSEEPVTSFGDPMDPVVNFSSEEPLTSFFSSSSSETPMPSLEGPMPPSEEPVDSFEPSPSFRIKQEEQQ